MSPRLRAHLGLTRRMEAVARGADGVGSLSSCLLTLHTRCWATVAVGGQVMRAEGEGQPTLTASDVSHVPLPRFTWPRCALPP